MGSHASQLTQEERWKLVYYVQKLQGPKTTAVLDSVEVFDASGKGKVVSGAEFQKMTNDAKKTEPAKH
jgi:hypothetical protein